MTQQPHGKIMTPLETQTSDLASASPPPVAESPHVPVIPPPRFFFGVALVSALFFAIWTWLVYGEMLPGLDGNCANGCEGWSKSNPGVEGFVVFLTDLGGIAAMTLVAIMGSIWQTAIKHRRLAIARLA